MCSPIRTLIGPPESAACAVSGCRDRIRCTAECDEESVPLGIHLGAVVRRERLPQQSPMLVESVRVGVSKLVQQFRRSLDVREEEGDDAGRKRGRHAAMITGRNARVYPERDVERA